MKAILCTTDFSSNSIASLKFGYTLSTSLHLKLLVLHVFDAKVILASSLSTAFAKKEQATFEKRSDTLKLFCDTHLGILPDGEHLQCIVKENALVDEAIIGVIQQFEPLMLVMGIKGGNPLQKLFIGSTTKKMIGKNLCPVLAIPPAWKDFQLKKLAYASDFEEADIHAIHWMVEHLVKPLMLSLDIIHISNVDEFAGEDQLAWFKEMLELKVSYNKVTYHRIDSEQIANSLQEHIKDNNINLLAMLEREKSGFVKSFVHVDLVKQMTSKATLPILSFNKKLF